MQLAQTQSTGTLRPCKEDSVDWDNTQNLYIEGDNLEVLKLLQKSYFGKIKMIYIDPPYNTGSDFVYPDNFVDGLGVYLELTNQTEGNKKKSTNPETGGRYHSNWLNMMYPRLKLARNLLSDDGTIFISIGDDEVDNLKKICDEIFGYTNRITQISWMSKSGGSADEKHIINALEYIIVYAKSLSNVSIGKENADSSDSKYRLSDQHIGSRGKYLLKKLDYRMTSKHYTETLNYPIEAPDGSPLWPGGEKEKQEGGWNWRWSQKKVEWGIQNGFLEFTKREGKWTLNSKQYQFVDNECNPTKREIAYKNFITSTLANTSQGSRMIVDFFGSKIFEYAKPVELFDILFRMSNVIENDIVLDFFSGSATTAHAIINLNAEDDGNRRFICVQLPEQCNDDSEAFKVGYKNICEIGKERIRRAGKQIKEEIEKENKQRKIDSEPKSVPDIGFKVFKLDSSNIKKWNVDTNSDLKSNILAYGENLKTDSGRTDLDVLYEIILKMGLEPIAKVDTINVNGKTIYSVSEGTLMVCLDDVDGTDVAERMVELYKEENPSIWNVVFKDIGFSDDSVKANTRETLKTAGLEKGCFVTL